ncbi:hypothetical protein BCR39DRAFT_557392 [Naematelia encephala]|uniref:Probable 26S proteasome regulatory subunit p27 n=1 Tax=Naematelia encephala TaxID=71784 RepID=A0A1Y2BDB4_9TREE|nr:hypothetical protein BCR39DRAFT_557392 [Naematelia encephala]
MALPTPAQPPSTDLPLPDPQAYLEEPREYARALMQRKDEIEKEMGALNDVLDSHGTTPSTSLLDPEGYPRADIDIYAIRHARAQLARLTTDHRTVSSLLVPALEAAFSPSFSSAGPSSSSNGAVGNRHKESNGHDPSVGRIADMPDEWPEHGVARVNSVAAASPAAEAGLQPGDVIHSFGSVISSTPTSFPAIAALVQRSNNVAITLLVQRGNERKRLRITPRTDWGGRGSLGCHILPI